VKDQLTKTLGKCDELEVRRSEAEEEKRLMAAKVRTPCMAQETTFVWVFFGKKKLI